MLSRFVRKYLPGMLLSIALLVGAGIWWLISGLMNLPDGPAYSDAKYALSRTGLSDMKEAASHCLYVDTHFRDGDAMAIFEVGYSERKALYDRIRETEGWREAEIPTRDYVTWAKKKFWKPGSLVRPMDDVVFDAMYFKDCYPGDSAPAYFSDRDWGEAPASLGMDEVPYTTDFDVAFYDRDSGLFVFYHQCM